MSVTRVAVIGLGAISQSVHLPMLRRNAEDFEIAALVDLSAERTADMGARYGVAADRRFSSVDALVAAKDDGVLAIDAAILATTGSHAGDTLRLVKAGIRVLAEKPSPTRSPSSTPLPPTPWTPGSTCVTGCASAT